MVHLTDPDERKKRSRFKWAVLILSVMLLFIATISVLLLVLVCFSFNSRQLSIDANYTSRKEQKETVKAAEQGNARAQFNLGYMYLYSDGVQRDHEEAIKWFTKAAEQGDASAQSYLGNMYCRGEGVTQDYVIAYKWLKLASVMFDKGKTANYNFVKKMTPKQIAEGEKLSNEFRVKPETKK